MKLLYINTIESGIDSENELPIVKAALLIGEKLIVVNYYFRYINFFLDFDKKSEREILNEYLASLHATQDAETYIQNLELNYKNLLLCRKTNGKTKDYILYQQRLEKEQKALKASIYTTVCEHLEKYKITSIIDFVKLGNFEIIDYRPQVYHLVEPLTERLIQYFLNTDYIQCFDYSIMDPDFEGYGKIIEEKDGKVIKEVLVSRDELLPGDEPIGIGMYVADLFVLPDLNAFTFSQLRIIRNEFQEKFQDFHKVVSDFKMEFENILFNDENEDRIYNRFSPVFEQQEALLKEMVGDNIYIQQLKNNPSEYPENAFKIAISSIETVVGFYKKRYMISEKEEQYVLDSIARYKDINTCCLFFYNEELKKDKQNIS